MKVLFNEKVIEVTKTFAEKASHFGSEEYHMLRTAMQDLPDFEVTIKPVRRNYRTNAYSGMTYAYMMNCFSACDNAEELMDEFMKLREYGCSYFQIRQWFLTKFPEFNNFAA